ncbi:lysylphosphatidylglycerol synthase transmembrane domain-containing protein [Antrihabitans cavernicola]|uniref:UPF0104 family protein n=1 Tax=Antrihabitans cavernicola TaxID=2495913 RepID=A0A5A7S3J6_9NOCA|nr:YbhN family protein [Spelaeibacter cavernicola]KAA0016320.1 UPF0104 family protein [Spelaeibacter cavernicola]
MGEPEADAPEVNPRRSRGRFWWFKWVVAVALAALLIAEGIYLWPRLHESWKALTEIHWGWVAISVAAQVLSLSSLAGLQRQLLRAGNVRVNHRKSLSVVYSSTAMSVTLPAGQVFSTAFTYRETRRWGASPIVASWQLAISGVISAAGLALLGVGGALLVGGTVNPLSLILSVAGVAAIIFGVHYASKRPDSIEAGARWILAKYNGFRDRPADNGMDRVQEILQQLESVDLNKRDAGASIGWALGHRFFDVACLGAACYAVGADPRVMGLLVAFATGKAVASIPLAPGGLGYFDATLIWSLTWWAGLTASGAVAAAFVYRAISFIMVAIIGWIVFLFIFRKHQHEDLGFDVETEQREQRDLRHKHN